MKRSSFLKSLLTILATPKVIAEVNFDKLASQNVAKVLASSSTNLFNDLNLLIPEWYKTKIEIYGSGDYKLWNEAIK